MNEKIVFNNKKIPTTYTDVIGEFKLILKNSFIVRNFWTKPHLALIDDKEISCRNFNHLIYYILMTYNQIRENKSPSIMSARCKYCHQNKNKTIESLALPIYQHKTKIKTILTSMFQIPADLTRRIFMVIKMPCHPFKGMLAWDMHNVMMDRIHKINYAPVVKNRRVFYHGIVYNKSTVDIQYKHIIRDMENMASEYNTHVALCATGTVTNPIHWCLIYICLVSKTFIFYNSLAKEEDQNRELFNILHAYDSEFRFVTNTRVWQGNSKLCGFFVYEMLATLCRTDSKRLEETFLAAYSNACQDGTICTNVVNAYIKNIPSKQFLEQGTSLSFKSNIFEDILKS